MTFVPAGRFYHEWHEPSSRLRAVCFYFDPTRFGALTQSPRLRAADPRPPCCFAFAFGCGELLFRCFAFERSVGPLSNAQIPRAEATIQVEFSSIVLAPGGPSTLEPPARGERLGGRSVRPGGSCSSVISPSSNCFRSRSPRSSSSASATSALLSSKPHGRQRLIFRFETAKQQFTAAETAKPKAPSKLGKAEKRVMT